jgi:nanoRNase/pAp phosphatase (c-di-AMP/oligoRNAs hydrolase)
MNNAKDQLAEKIKSANNILVAVSRNPSVDQLAALLGLGLALNKLGKHCAAVFSGNIPPAIKFLEPEKVIEKTTDSLQDFIIALDKNKADKLRYKVEDNIVKIFITPYRTSISDEDLEFSQGDFNVDLVIALGVKNQEDLDEAITAHGRILHDATVASINSSPDGGLGSINWHEQASSLSELVAEVAQMMSQDILDEQIATALLTGIVAETNRFSNERTSSQTMSISASLMAAGANQQLVATKLEEPVEEMPEQNSEPPEDGNEQNNDGMLEIEHVDVDKSPEPEAEKPEEPEPLLPPMPEPEQPLADAEQGKGFDFEPLPNEPKPPQDPTLPTATDNSNLTPGPKLMTEAPTLGGTLTANTEANKLDPATDPFSVGDSAQHQLLDHNPDETAAVGTKAPDIQPLPPPLPTPPPATPDFQPAPGIVPPPAPVEPPPIHAEPSLPAPKDEPTEPPDPNAPPQIQIDNQGTLSKVQLTQPINTDDARQEVTDSIEAVPSTYEPPKADLHAEPLGPDLHPEPPASPPPFVSPANPGIPFEFGSPPTAK